MSKKPTVDFPTQQLRGTKRGKLVLHLQYTVTLKRHWIPVVLYDSKLNSVVHFCMKRGLYILVCISYSLPVFQVKFKTVCLMKRGMCSANVTDI